MPKHIFVFLYNQSCIFTVVCIFRFIELVCITAFHNNFLYWMKFHSSSFFILLDLQAAVLSRTKITPFSSESVNDKQDQALNLKPSIIPHNILISPVQAHTCTDFRLHVFRSMAFYHQKEKRKNEGICMTKRMECAALLSGVIKSSLRAKKS